MRRLQMPTFLFALLGLAILFPSSFSFSEPDTIKERIIGTWTFATSNAKRSDGTPLWGSDPRGLFILTKEGHFSWQVFRSDRPDYPDRLKASADEYKETMLGSLAYFGTYTIDEKERTITFKTIGSTFPHSEGEIIKRVITILTDDELTYSNPATTTGANVQATWKRVK